MQPTARPAPRGFTLLELMVVIVILGLLVAIVGPNVLRQEAIADRETTKAQMSRIADAIHLYSLEHHGIPASLSDLTTPGGRSGEAYLDRIPKDSWGKPFGYRVTDAVHRRFEITSAGPDGKEGTEDDLAWPFSEDGP